MTERSLTPNITVTIGHHTRIYFAFVTTAPAELDSPATVTLHAATFADVAGFAAEPLTRRRHSRPGTGATGPRRCDGARLATRDSTAAISIRCCRRIPVLVGLNTLQHWLWQRLQAPATSQVAA